MNDMSRKVACDASAGKVTWLRVQIHIAPAARKHHITDENMLHAFRNPTRVEYHDDGFTMIRGADWGGNPLEVGFIEADDGVVIIHADRDRRQERAR
jgi:hypothetical protein